MAFQPRIPVRFESADGSETLTFPLAGYQVEISQDMDTPAESLAGVDGQWDTLGEGEARLGAIAIRLSFEAVESAPEEVDAVVDEVRAKLRRFGQGKLWTVGRDDGGNDVERWTWMRATAKPTERWAAGDVLRKALTVSARGGPYWFEADEVIVDEEVESSPLSLNVDVPGTAPVYWMRMLITSESAAGFENLVIENLTNGYALTGSRSSASVDDVMRIDTERWAFEFSDDAGATWSDDYASWEEGPLQVAPFRLEGGQTNVLRLTCDGTPEYSFRLTFTPAWE